MTYRQAQRQPSTSSTSTYFTASSTVNRGQHEFTQSILRRQASKYETENPHSSSVIYPVSFDQLIPLSGNYNLRIDIDTSAGIIPGATGAPVTRNQVGRQAKTSSSNSSNNSSNNSNNSNNYICTGVPNEEPLPHYVLIPIGKTGDGKSSLLNSLFGYQEFKAAAAAKSVTDTVVERTGVWTVDKMNAVVTVADTPGFADSAGRDFTLAIQDYITDVSDRVGIDAFLLVFQLHSQQVMSILKGFAELMKDMEPKNWWDHVILVFTRVDYTTEPQKLIQKKRYITQTLRDEIMTTFNLDNPPPTVFVSSKVHQCPLLFGKECDCVEVKFYQNERMRILKEAIATCSERGRWRATKSRLQPVQQQSSSPIASQPSSMPQAMNTTLSSPPPPPPAHSYYHH